MAANAVSDALEDQTCPAPWTQQIGRVSEAVARRLLGEAIVLTGTLRLQQRTGIREGTETDIPTGEYKHRAVPSSGLPRHSDWTMTHVEVVLQEHDSISITAGAPSNSPW
jgi:hypothetical protein